jgi:hypothetical protein
MEEPFSNRASFVNGWSLPRVTVLSAVGIIRRNILVRSTGAAMSTTSWHAMTPLKALAQAPVPSPGGQPLHP